MNINIQNIIYTSTGRPSNRFGGVNFKQINLMEQDKNILVVMVMRVV